MIYGYPGLDGWEYELQVFGFNDTPAQKKFVLNAMGNDGWELVSIDSGITAYFKRRIPNATE